jgi:5S rRNA maturation endonuclease (ribonuclease M5)
VSVYGTSPIRRRRSREEIASLDVALAEIAYEVAPATVRQIFYQAVVRGLVPKSETTGYRVVQRRLLKLREDGTIPYGLITDNARMVRTRARWNSPEHFAREAAARYRRDYWADFPVRVEVWLEKDALAGVLTPAVVDECGLDLYVTRGFASVTYLQEAAEFMLVDERPTFVYVLTDFDPSGLSIAETVERELVERSWPTRVEVERLAVTREQIDLYELPTRPTKTTDTRARRFEHEHGTGSVELDAIPPDTLRSLVKRSIEQHMDRRKLSLLKLAEREEREGIKNLFGGAA